MTWKNQQCWAGFLDLNEIPLLDGQPDFKCKYKPSLTERQNDKSLDMIETKTKINMEDLVLVII